MSDHDNFDTSAGQRVANKPYTSRHPIPNVQRYEQEQEHRREVESRTDDEDSGEHKNYTSIVKSYLHLNGKSEQSGDGSPYYSLNRNAQEPTLDNGDPGQDDHEDDEQIKKRKDDPGGAKDTEQGFDTAQDPRQKRKNLKNRKEDTGSRVVTDPVTHLPVTIHDSTAQELKNVPANLPPSGSEPRTAAAASKDDSQLRREHDEAEAEHEGMQKLFPPSEFHSIKDQMATLYRQAVVVGLSVSISTSVVVLFICLWISGSASRSRIDLMVISFVIPISGVVFGGVFIYAVQGWIHRKIGEIWDDKLWEASKTQEQRHVGSPTPESTQWLNSILASIWPLINPDLFTSLADTLEDVMQASLPKAIRMISVEDLGQGSEAIRILGVRWLPTGAAAQSVSVDGNLKGDKNEDSDRKVSGEGEVQDDTKPKDSEGQKNQPKDQQGDSEDQNIAEGMEAEEGDFVNMEVAFAYRASSTGKGIMKKAQNAHLFLEFYLPGGVKFPVWVELKGFVGTLRMRLQLCPDPPFFSLCTLTLLGQPKATLSCVPLTKHGLNIMDLPIVSPFVQSSIDAALAEYVAPKSLTLDIKDMLMGNDFKEDTAARGVIMVHIKRAEKFKEGNISIAGLRKGSSDPYISLGWAKFAKPVWSTRIIFADMEPVWDETAFVLVTPQEVNADERLRVQIWDSDRMSADDDLGKVELDLKEIMHDSRSAGKMWDREDELMAVDAGEKMPGSLKWSVGWFQKVRIQHDQLDQQTADPEIKSVQQLKYKVSEEEQKKLREATDRDVSKETDIQKAKDLKDKEDQIVISAPPPGSYPSGILSIEIHNITGLQYESLNKNKGEGDEGDDMDDGDHDLPSSYCTIILNHKKIFQTRTKPKNSKPFFNAATERMVRNWRETDIMVSIRDARVHEDDPLLGIVYLPLANLFHNRSQVMDEYPIVGGIAYGRIRISMVFRSVALKLPKELLGWDYGTLEITGPVTSKNLPEDLRSLRIKLRTSVNRGKMYSSHSDGRWTPKKDRNVRLGVRQRYSSSLIVEFRKSRITLDSTPAFAVLRLKEIPDDEEMTVSIPVWKGGMDLKRVENNCRKIDSEQLGSIDIPLKLWHGLSSYHKNLTRNNQSLRDVFEALDTACDTQEINEGMEGDDANDSDSSDSELKEVNPKSTFNKIAGLDHDQQTDGHRGPLEQLKDYSDHRKELHRQHRGIMQYKGARTMRWMRTKVEHGKDHIVDAFQHHERNPGIETET